MVLYGYSVSAQVSQVEDFIPGIDGIHPRYLKSIGNDLYFQGSTTNYGQEFFIYNGDSISMIDIEPSTASSAPRYFTEYNGEVYFSAYQTAYGRELYKYDGTTVSNVSDIVSGPLDSDVSQLISYDTLLVFVATDGASWAINRELWTYDGANFTSFDVNPIGTSDPENLTIVGDTLFFTAINAAGLREVWKFDGVNVTAVTSTGSGFPPDLLTAVGDTLFYVANDNLGGGGHQLWKYHGGVSTLLSAINPGLGANIDEMVNANGILYFNALDPAIGNELFWYDGSVHSLDIAPSNMFSSDPRYLTALDSLVFFTAWDVNKGNEFMKFDGTTGVLEVFDMTPGISGTSMENFIAFGQEVYFMANVSPLGSELYKYNGMDTELVEDINPTSGSSPQEMAIHNGLLFFRADDGTTGPELWKLDCVPTSTNVSVTSCLDYTVPSGTTTYNTSGIYKDTLTSLYGCDSILNINLTITGPTSSSQTLTECPGFSLTVGTNVYNSSGVYLDTLTTVNGCDSIVATNLTINSIDTAISYVNGVELMASASGLSYQWLDCDNGFAIITGATNQNFVASSNGNYAVLISDGACSDTSACLSVTSVGVDESIAKRIRVFPNPSNGVFTVQTDWDNRLNLHVVNALGELVYISSDLRIDLTSQPAGIYFLVVTSEQYRRQVRLIKY